MNSWVYRTETLTESMIPASAIGFLYEIKNLKNGKRYLGKKLLTKAATRTVNKKKIKYRKESDWKDYWSSSPWLLEILESEGKENFERRILCFADSKGALNYMEECAQYKLGVLESDNWYNSNIRSRIFKKNVVKYDLKEFHLKMMAYNVC